MMNNITVTNEMLYELFKEFREDFKGFKIDVNRRFDEVDKRFEQIDKRFTQLEDAQSEDRKILRDLWENRDKQTLNFSSIYFAVTLTASILAAVATSYILP